MQSDRRLSALKRYIENHPNVSIHAAATQIATNDPDTTVAKDSLIRRLLRHYDASGENYAKWGSKTPLPKHPVSIEQLESDGKEQWEHLRGAMADSFISGLKQAFRKFDKKDI